MNPTVFICSVELEGTPLLERMEGVLSAPIRDIPVWRGALGRQPVLLVVGGMGKTNAAHALTSVLQLHAAAGVVGFGVAGAYPRSGLRVGDVAVATSEIYGDEGVETPGGWISTEGIGIPLHEGPRGRVFNEFPAETNAVAAVAGALRTRGPVAAGPFVTLSCCSGTARRGAEIEERFGAVCETMEGAAYAHVAARFALPWLEIRGISNAVEDRDPGRWRLAEAASAAAAAAAAALETWIPHARTAS